jgi:hypothetical protein
VFTALNNNEEIPHTGASFTLESCSIQEISLPSMISVGKTLSTALMSTTVALFQHHHSWYIVADSTHLPILAEDGDTITN